MMAWYNHFGVCSGLLHQSEEKAFVWFGFSLQIPQRVPWLEGTHSRLL